MRYTFLFLFLFFSIDMVAQSNYKLYSDNDFNETFVDSLELKIDTILILGMGTSLERIFLEDLSVNLTIRFKQKDIKTTYIFLGNNSQDIRKNYKLIDKKAYSAILLCRPKDTALYNPSVGGNWVAPSGARIPSTKINYEQEFDLSLITNNLIPKNIWNAIADIDCDPSNKYGAKRLASKIFARFKSNKYID